MGRWDVLRDGQGNAITLTPDQVRAVWHALRVWTEVCEAEGSHQADRVSVTQAWVDIGKSRLVGRMLIDGRPPLDKKPRRWQGGCAYHEVEPDLDHFYMGAPLIAVRHPDGTLEPIEPIRPASALRRWRRLLRRSSIPPAP